MSVVGDWFWTRVGDVVIALANIRARIRRPRVVHRKPGKKKLP